MAGKTITLNPDGPHSAEYTREVAHSMAEAVRVLNHATADPAGLECPSDVAVLIESLGQAVSGLEQTCGQLGRWLGNEYQADRLVESSAGRHGGNTAAAMTDALGALDHAVAAIRVLAARLNQVHQITHALEAKVTTT
jgi:hypothetical protein